MQIAVHILTVHQSLVLGSGLDGECNRILIVPSVSSMCCAKQDATHHNYCSASRLVYSTCLALPPPAIPTDIGYFHVNRGMACKTKVQKKLLLKHLSECDNLPVTMSSDGVGRLNIGKEYRLATVTVNRSSSYSTACN